MKYIPHDYQRCATEFILNHPKAAILLQMGLGKSVITLTAIRELIDRGEVQRILVIAPLRVARDTWPEEIRKWDHLRGMTYSVMTGTPEERRKALREPATIHIINRENVPWLVDEMMKNSEFRIQNSKLSPGNGGRDSVGYDMIVVDELSSFKNQQAKRFRSLMRVRPYVKRIVGLTGTPAPNGYMDLFAEYRLLDMGERLGWYLSIYRDRYFLPDRWGNGQVYSWKLRPGAAEAIEEKIRDITVSMKSADFLSMPECLMNRITVSMDQRERKLYETMKEEMFLKVRGNSELSGVAGEILRRASLAQDDTWGARDSEFIIDAKNASALSNKLSQMANGAVYSEDGTAVRIHERKLDALEDLIESANGNPLLIAYWFRHDFIRIKARFPEIRELRTTGDFQDWNAGRIPVAAIHPASAGHGLNLQDGGNQLVWFGLTWSLELYQQTNARLWRQGQKAETVVIHHIITEGTIDEQIMAALNHKDLSQKTLINAVKAQMKGDRNYVD